MNKWYVKYELYGDDEWASIPDDIARWDDHELIACEWWEQTFSDRDYIEDGVLQVRDADGLVKRYQVGIEAVPQAHAKEIQ